MKTNETLDMEKTLYAYCRQLLHTVVEEVSLPNDCGIVDTLSLSPENEFTCYELKVTKADFHSNAKLSFIGNYNYFVLPRHLVPKVIDDVPDNVGVLVFDYFEPALVTSRHLTVPGYFTPMKKPLHQPLSLDYDLLLTHFIHSLNREVDKAKRIATGLKSYPSKQLLEELNKRRDQGRFDDLTENAYTHFFAETTQQEITALSTEVNALKTLLTQQQQQLWRLTQQQPKLPFFDGGAHDL
ncbi:MmcB family DNA repair protein [Agrilactobacillus yilanensis]|uniref:MmcB family DNA repair protein n=1 Tax=Agrilactobacillus yilanensis TaxID=2485997 RepID=A0ABW4J2A2_9LACO|nr:MmcB family DNA repair protein [Agrilactobacillus yilanensis]